MNEFIKRKHGVMIKEYSDSPFKEETLSTIPRIYSRYNPFIHIHDRSRHECI